MNESKVLKKLLKEQKKLRSELASMNKAIEDPAAECDPVLLEEMVAFRDQTEQKLADIDADIAALPVSLDSL